MELKPKKVLSEETAVWMLDVEKLTLNCISGFE